jgi:large subunit ribosomal protein L10
MATRAEKDQAITELIGEIKGTNVLYLTDASSMDAESTSALRRACNKGGVRMKVVKNSLLRKAMERVEGKDYSGLFPTLAGQTAVLFAEKGNAPAKMIKDFRKKGRSAPC